MEYLVKKRMNWTLYLLIYHPSFVNIILYYNIIIMYLNEVKNTLKDMRNHY